MLVLYVLSKSLSSLSLLLLLLSLSPVLSLPAKRPEKSEIASVLGRGSRLSGYRMSLAVMEAKRKQAGEEKSSWLAFCDAKEEKSMDRCAFCVGGGLGAMHGVSLMGALIGEWRSEISGLDSRLRSAGNVPRCCAPL